MIHAVTDLREGPESRIEYTYLRRAEQGGEVIEEVPMPVVVDPPKRPTYADLAGFMVEQVYAATKMQEKLFESAAARRAGTGK